MAARPVIDLLDSEGVLCLPQQSEKWAECARRHVVALQRDGTSHYVGNVDADVSLLRVDEQLMPVVVARRHGRRNGARPLAAICSERSHYAEYTREEMTKRHPEVAAWLLGLAFQPFSAMLRFGELDRVVYVNHWLLTTNPVARFRRDQLSAIVDELTRRFPKAAIVFRGLMPRLYPNQFKLFQGVGFRMVRHRRVWVVEDCELACRESKELRRDVRLSDQHGYEILSDPEIIANEAERIAELYQGLYIHKHSHLNPYFNPAFVPLTLDEGLLTYRAFRSKDGSIDAFKAWHIRNGVMTGAVVGYDRHLPRSLGLYRQAMALQSREAARLGLKLVLSGGVGEFKRLRGADPHEEHEAVWDRHLSPRRKLPWVILERLGRRVVASQPISVSQKAED